MNPDVRATDCRGAADCLAADCRRTCPLSALDLGRCARVIDIRGARHLRRRLLALGVRPNAELRVVGRAPQRGPLELRVGTVHLMMREHEAQEVIVEFAWDEHAAQPTV